MAKVVVFGEIMLRLAPEGYYRFAQSEKYEATFGGAEANVAVSLSNFGIDSDFITKIPQNQLGDAAVNSLRRYGVGVENIIRGGERLGIYFMERGASQRSSMVIYDRKYSAIQLADSCDFNWEKIFKDADWFHFTGITPALGHDMPEICLKACKTAKKMGIKISCDLNYRKKLWSKEAAGTIMSRIMPYVDVCMANEEDAESYFGIKAPDSDFKHGKISNQGYEHVARSLQNKFGFEAVAITLRKSHSASDNGWMGMLYSGGDFNYSREYGIHIVDRVGGGDAFSAGLIYGMLNGFEDQKALEFAVGASCIKHTIEGDFNHCSVSEVMNLIGGETAGRVQR